MKIYKFSSAIGQAIERYIDLKRSLGRKFETEYHIFKHLDLFLVKKNQNLTANSFAEWCCFLQYLSASTRRHWMQCIRHFSLYLRRTQPSCFVPDPSQFPLARKPIQPHIFTEHEIIRLLNATKQLKAHPGSPLYQENYRLALILFYTTGLRRGELVRLTIRDYNSKEHTLLIRGTKFHKSRLIPLSKDGWKEIETLLAIRRKRQLSPSADSPLFWNARGGTGSYAAEAVRATFRSLFYKSDIYTVRGELPRIHDFRHTFAVHALLRWYQDGADVQAKLPLLSTYMGHVSILSTEYYLHFIDDVVSAASERFAKNYSKLVAIPKIGGEA